jgi:hypothetical protein
MYIFAVFWRFSAENALILGTTHRYLRYSAPPQHNFAETTTFTKQATKKLNHLLKNV